MRISSNGELQLSPLQLHQLTANTFDALSPLVSELAHGEPKEIQLLQELMEQFHQRSSWKLLLVWLEGLRFAATTPSTAIDHPNSWMREVNKIPPVSSYLKNLIEQSGIGEDGVTQGVFAQLRQIITLTDKFEFALQSLDFAEAASDCVQGLLFFLEGKKAQPMLSLLPMPEFMQLMQACTQVLQRDDVQRLRDMEDLLLILKLSCNFIRNFRVSVLSESEDAALKRIMVRLIQAKKNWSDLNTALKKHQINQKYYPLEVAASFTALIQESIKAMNMDFNPESKTSEISDDQKWAESVNACREFLKICQQYKEKKKEEARQCAELRQKCAKETKDFETWFVQQGGNLSLLKDMSELMHTDKGTVVSQLMQGMVRSMEKRIADDWAKFQMVQKQKLNPNWENLDLESREKLKLTWRKMFDELLEKSAFTTTMSNALYQMHQIVLHREEGSHQVGGLQKNQSSETVDGNDLAEVAALGSKEKVQSVLDNLEKKWKEHTLEVEKNNHQQAALQSGKQTQIFQKPRVGDESFVYYLTHTAGGSKALRITIQSALDAGEIGRGEYIEKFNNVAELLIAHDITEIDGLPALFFLARVGLSWDWNGKVFDALINKEPASLLQSQFGNTALLIAVRSNNLDVVKRILSHPKFNLHELPLGSIEQMQSALSKARKIAIAKESRNNSDSSKINAIIGEYNEVAYILNLYDTKRRYVESREGELLRQVEAGSELKVRCILKLKDFTLNEYRKACAMVLDNKNIRMANLLFEAYPHTTLLAIFERQIDVPTAASLIQMICKGDENLAEEFLQLKLHIANARGTAKAQAQAYQHVLEAALQSASDAAGLIVSILLGNALSENISLTINMDRLKNSTLPDEAKCLLALHDYQQRTRSKPSCFFRSSTTREGATAQGLEQILLKFYDGKDLKAIKADMIQFCETHPIDNTIVNLLGSYLGMDFMKHSPKQPLTQNYFLQNY